MNTTMDTSRPVTAREALFYQYFFRVQQGSSPRRRMVRLATSSNDFTEVAFRFALIYKAFLQSKIRIRTSFTKPLLP